MELRITDRVPTASPRFSSQDALRMIQERIDEYNSIDYVYILDNDILAGVVSIREILSHNERLEDFMHREIICFTPEDDPFDIPTWHFHMELRPFRLLTVGADSGVW